MTSFFRRCGARARTQCSPSQVLKQAGYATHAIGKWDLGMTTWAMTPTNRGFDTFLGYYNAKEDRLCDASAALRMTRRTDFYHFMMKDYTDANGTSQACGGMDLRNGTAPVADQSEVLAGPDAIPRPTRAGTRRTCSPTRRCALSATIAMAMRLCFCVCFDAIASKLTPAADTAFQVLLSFTTSASSLHAQAVHAPLQVPDRYIQDTECARIRDSRNRSIFCGMMKTVDEVGSRAAAARLSAARRASRTSQTC